MFCVCSVGFMFVFGKVLRILFWFCFLFILFYLVIGLERCFVFIVVVIFYNFGCLCLFMVFLVFVVLFWAIILFCLLYCFVRMSFGLRHSFRWVLRFGWFVFLA